MTQSCHEGSVKPTHGESNRKFVDVLVGECLELKEVAFTRTVIAWLSCRLPYLLRQSSSC